MGRSISVSTGATNLSVTASSAPLGGVVSVMPGSSAAKAVGSVLSRAVYSAMAAAYPGQSMYYSLQQTLPANATATVGYLSAIAYGANIYVAVLGGNLFSSVDLVNWVQRTT